MILTITGTYALGKEKGVSLHNGSCHVWPGRGERLVRVDDGAAWKIVGIDLIMADGTRNNAIETHREPFRWPMVHARDHVGLLLMDGGGAPSIGDRVVFAGMNQSVDDAVSGEGLARCDRCGSISCAQSEYDCRTNGSSYGCSTCGGDTRGTCRC